MIPPPPPDRALPALPELLDGEAMGARLAAALAGPGGATLVACRPDYVRYKPGTNCLVGYDTRWTTGRGAAVDLPVHVIAYAGDRADRLASKPVLRALAAAGAEPGLGLGSVAHLPDCAALAQLYPVDRKLPALVPAARGVGVAELLGWSPGTATTPHLVRYKPGRKALLRYEGPGGLAAYAKLHGYERRPEIVDWTRHLRQAGLATPAVLGWQQEGGLLLHAAAPGRPLKALRGEPGYGRWMAPAAAMLAHLHELSAPAALPPRRDHAGMVAAAAAAIAALQPDLSSTVQDLARRIVAALSATDGPVGLMHGDFYDDQLLVSEEGLWLLDLDELGLGEPLADVANHLAHLALLGEGYGAARAAFLDAYTRHRPCPPAALAAHEAAALLCLAAGPFRHLRPDWPAAVARVVALAVAALARGAVVGSARGGRERAPAVPATVAPASDPALPQLEAVLDTRAVNAALAGVLAASQVQVTGARVVRHKPGRRAILRYTGRLDGRQVTFYGKVFASGRGAGVLDRMARLAAAVDPAAVVVPAPLAYLPQWQLLLQWAVAGSPLEPAVLAGDEVAARAVARALHALHTAPVDLGRRHGWTAEWAILAERVGRLAGRAPTLGAAAKGRLAALSGGPPPGTAWRDRPIHRDFYPSQVLLDGPRVAILDLDDVTMGELALDVANFLAHLTLLALDQPAQAGASRCFAAAFLAEARRLDAALDPTLLAYLESATLLRLAEIHHGRPGAPATEQLLAASAAAWPVRHALLVPSQRTRRRWVRKPGRGTIDLRALR